MCAANFDDSEKVQAVREEGKCNVENVARFQNLAFHAIAQGDGTLGLESTSKSSRPWRFWSSQRRPLDAGSLRESESPQQIHGGRLAQASQAPRKSPTGTARFQLLSPESPQNDAPLPIPGLACFSRVILTSLGPNNAAPTATFSRSRGSLPVGPSLRNGLANQPARRG
ncbi:hypothetical protein BJX63DRAFT_40774 [Aspergillus granulosus]|uniref:Uncharacterized protein n=1 Tax=Aspergillus granulosus TaxID=176169 RepID=A0ABR4GYH1_9EURO